MKPETAFALPVATNNAPNQTRDVISATHVAHIRFMAHKNWP